MSRSASCYTNLRKMTALAKNNKVDYPGHVAKNWNPLASTLGCNPIFDVQEYIDIASICQPKKLTAVNQPECKFDYDVIVLIYSGGYSETEDPDHYDGGSTYNTVTTILDGGTSTTG